MPTDFDPKNDLERALLAAMTGTLDGEAFMAELLKAQVFMPVQDKHGIAGLQTSQSAVPLTLDTEEGYQVLVLFTSPERARAFVQDHPGYEGGLLTEFTWVLEKMGTGLGITLNPGWDAGIDMAPEMVRDLTQGG